MKWGIDELYDQQEYLENHSRRNNIKVLGIQESEGGETGEESKKLVKDAIKEHLQIADDLSIKRAHRVGNHTLHTAMFAGQRSLVNQGLSLLASRYGKKRKRLSGLQGSLSLHVFNSLRILPSNS